MSAEAERKTETIPEWKREEVDSIVEMIESYDSIGVVAITGIPSRQLQDMRRGLHGTAELRVSRNTLLERALDEVDAGLEQLGDYVSGQVGLIGTNDNPFGLYKELEASKTPAPISAGEIAPNDIVIPEGDTGVDPGPFVGELQNVGANARIDGGSIKVVEDSTVLEAGGEVSTDLENVLGELGIEPKEVGLDLRGVFADGVLFEPEELELDVEEYEADIKAAASAGWNLSVNAEYPTTQNASTLLQNARGDAKSLAVFASIEDPEVVPDLVSKADAQVRAIAAQIDDEEALPEELQGVDAQPAATDASTDEDETDAETEDTSDDAEAEAAEDDDDDDDDDDEDAGDALGAMF
ncbi:MULTISPECIES: 50S ribosomal protein L10 [Halomicrobium]|uniref:Large ribosomal subunit protein uL10 n=2 Tax=Halomicrobium mukohataei TaxID=57705 RepID=C7NWT8_HALMD|nr:MULTISPECIES: 50S ribosomal protein L10 [Halomicrobium]ACV48298.1 ribosomal protein L10 [Halomicrobium mukohataei DSM 12286]QCD66715.1 50S ribosomal protein L10 [Halomicrobium mukohataei]QFR21521.1 50S ribosomal protein L10 [Halomicrobium sp. ZPS1]